MKKVFFSAGAALLCLLTGFIASRFQTESLAIWYPTLNKSPLTPPNSAFPIAWSLLYGAMGVSIGLIGAAPGPRARVLMALFALQLALNFSWSIAFFYFQSPGTAFIIIVALLVFLFVYTGTAWRSYRTSALLFLPYSAWTLFAAYLNGYIVINN